MVAVIAVVGTFATTGCGGDEEEEEETQKVSLVLTETQGGEQVSFAGTPDSADPGLVEITLRNDGTRDHEAQMFRVEGEHTAGVGPTPAPAKSQSGNGRPWTAAAIP
jgi:hypothetical protein